MVFRVFLYDVQWVQGCAEDFQMGVAREMFFSANPKFLRPI